MRTDDFKYIYRVGLGTDIHALTKGNRLMLGGVFVDHHSGPIAHSDGDVIIHAVIDAILGATGMGDIGEVFPDDDPEFEDMDSGVMLSNVTRRIEEDRWEVVNLDVTVKAQAPRLKAYKPQMKRSLASLLGMDFAAVNVKAKTNEGLDAVGHEEAVEALAVVLLRQRQRRTL
jgi:2-C-methyl-D-erythritol 2,4-cyclodiphosphate synthase